MILINNPWGESNEKGLLAALAEKGMKPAGVEKFETNDVDVVPQLTRLKQAGADAPVPGRPTSRPPRRW
jgi:branched-chain amino acid transport system substrate-binding protein